jgi:hypothetical protein
MVVSQSDQSSDGLAGDHVVVIRERITVAAIFEERFFEDLFRFDTFFVHVEDEKQDVHDSTPTRNLPLVMVSLS